MMKKILIAVVAILCVAAVIIVFNNAITGVYSGETDNETMSLTFNDNSFTLTHEIYESNSYNKTIYIYEGTKDQSELYVHKITTRTMMFGTLISERISDGLNKNLKEYCFRYDTNGYYIINDIPLTSKGATYSYNLVCITSIDQYETHTVYTTLLKGSTKSDLASLGLIEIYGDGSAVRYAVTEDSYGDIDLDTVGIKEVNVTYGEGKTAKMTVEIVDFTCNIKPLEPGITLNEAIIKGMIEVTPSDVVLSSPNWDSTAGDKMITLKSESGYSKDYYVNFVPATNKDVVAYQLYGYTDYIEQESNLPSFTFDMTLKNGNEYRNISSNDAQIKGYDRHTAGAQVLTVYYDKCAFNIALFVYNSEQSIPIKAKLVNNSITPYISDGKILYDRSGIAFSEYSIEIELTNGKKTYQPLTKEMIRTSYDEWIDPEQPKDIPCTIHSHIGDFHYRESAVMTYDPLEKNVKSSLTILRMLDGCDTVTYTATMNDGTDTEWVVGFDSRGFYIANDLLTGSSYRSTYLTYSNLNGINGFDCYLGTETNDFLIAESLIDDAVMTNKTHTPDGIYTVSFHIVVNEKYAERFKEFGFKAGDEYDFDVTYDFFTMKSTYVRTTTDCPLSKVAIYYDPATVHYSDAVKSYMEKKSTVALTVKYTDGSQRIFDIITGTEIVDFICDEGHGVYKDAEGTRPYTVPETGINVSQTLYYV